MNFSEIILYFLWEGLYNVVTAREKEVGNMTVKERMLALNLFRLQSQQKEYFKKLGLEITIKKRRKYHA